MTENCNNKNSLQRDGTSQNQRLLVVACLETDVFEDLRLEAGEIGRDRVPARLEPLLVEVRQEDELDLGVGRQDVCFRLSRPRFCGTLRGFSPLKRTLPLWLTQLLEQAGGNTVSRKATP